MIIMPSLIFKRVILLLSLILIISEAYGQSRPDSFTFLFNRVQESENAIDTLNGSAYYFDGKLYLHVSYPVNQFFFVDDRKIKIYYPESKRGYDIISDAPFDLPIVNSLIAFMKDDYGLAKIGFIIRSNSVSGDTLIAHWEHMSGPDSGKFEIYYKDDIIVKARYSAKSIFLETVLKDHKTFGGYLIPTHIETRNSSLRNSEIESLFVEQLSINPEIPDSIMNFDFPDDAVIEKRKF